MDVLPRPLVAVAVALAGIRTGARVLDLTPSSGLGPVLLAGAGPSGRVTPIADCPADTGRGGGDEPEASAGADASGDRAGHALLVDPATSPQAALDRLEQVRNRLCPDARVTICCAGDRAGLLRAVGAVGGWRLVHVEEAAGIIFAVLLPGATTASARQPRSDVPGWV